MKSTELKIGNIVKYNQEKYNVKCINIYSANIEKGPNEYTVPFTELEGIEITEDALFDLGFAKKYDLYILYICEICVDIIKSDSHDFWYVSLNDSVDIKMKYIHQLQNIISALTEDI